MANIFKVMKGISETLNLPLDQSKSYIAGNYNGYTIIINRVSVSGYYSNINFSITAFNPSTNATITPDSVTNLVENINSKTKKKFANASLKNCRLDVTFTNIGKASTLILNICNSIAYIVQTLQMNYFIPCDEFSGRTENVMPVITANEFHIVDSISYNEINSRLSYESNVESNTKENFAGGIIGGLLGALIGVLCIILIGQLNYVSVISGIVMGYATFALYKKFARKISWIGIIICFVIMILMIYFAMQINYAIWIVRYYSDINILDAFSAIPEIKEYSSEFANEYNQDLVLCYLFSLMGAIITLIDLLRTQKNKFSSTIIK